MDEEKSFGGCEGPDAMYVKLISSDGHEFIVKRDHALTSGTIKAMLSGPGELCVQVHVREFTIPFGSSIFRCDYASLHVCVRPLDRLCHVYKNRRNLWLKVIRVNIVRL